MTQAHIWTIPLDEPESERGAAEILSADERIRAHRFLAERDRRRFTACRAALRRILASLIDADPAAVKFNYSSFGKPLLAGEYQSEIHFNISHSDNLALIAVATGRAIGVDLERVRSDLAADEIAGRFFSPSERAALANLPAESKSEAFFRCWTRKEAFIKAIGEGLSYPLDAFDVTLTRDEPARLLRVGNDPAEAARWSICDLKVPHGFVAALAARSAASEVVYRDDFI